MRAGMRKLIAPVALAIAAAVPAAAAEGILTDVNWPNLYAYCTFQRADASFEYDKPETWTFVYFTQHAADRPGDVANEVGYVSLSHRLRELELIETVQGKDGETRRYRTYGRDIHEVTLTMRIAEVGYENIEYTGHLTVEGPLGEESIEVKGGCGV